MVQNNLKDIIASKIKTNNKRNSNSKKFFR